MSDSILSILKLDGWRFGNCTVRVYDRRRTDIWGDHFLERLYDFCRLSKILTNLFCGMVDLSSDAICAYLHTRSPLLIMCVDGNSGGPVDFDIAGFAFPTISIGGLLIPNPAGGPPARGEASVVAGYGYFRPYWGTPESVVLGMLTLAYFFENHNLTAIHGQSYSWNGLTAKFTSQFGVKRVGVIPRFLQTQDGSLVDCVLSTVLREEFEEYVRNVIQTVATGSIEAARVVRETGDGQGRGG